MTRSAFSATSTQGRASLTARIAWAAILLVGTLAGPLGNAATNVKTTGASPSAQPESSPGADTDAMLAELRALSGDPADAEGTPRAWGYNVYGQLGDGTNDDSNLPVQVLGLGGIVDVASGGHHVLALRSGGTVWAWGANGDGQLGDDTTADSNVPVPVGGLTGVVAIAAGAYHSMALKSDGTVWTWGRNNREQLGASVAGSQSSPVQVRDPSDPTGFLTGVTSIAAGQSHCLGLKADKTVVSWGANDYGQLGDGAIPQPNASRGHPLAVRQPGVPSPIPLDDVTAIACGFLHNLALKSDSTVWAWGANGYGQLGDITQVGRSLATRTDPERMPRLDPGDPDPPPVAIALAAGAYHSLAIKSDGKVWAWGADDSGQCGSDNIIIQNWLRPILVRDHADPTGFLTDGMAIAGGVWHSLAIKSDGTVFAWGNNQFGQIGDGTRDPRFSAVPTAPMPPMTSVAAGFYHSVAVHAAPGNQPPVVEAGDDQSANEGDSVSLQASFTDPDPGDGHAASVDWGDGTVDDAVVDESTGAIVANHVYADNGAFTVTIVVTDAAGDTGQDAFVAYIANVAPSVDAGPDQTIELGASVSLSGAFVDPGQADTHEISWDLGDGTVVAPANLAVDHTYAAPGVYTATLTVEDDDGDASGDEVVITVRDTTPPQVGAVSLTPSPAKAGGVVSVSAPVSDNYDLASVEVRIGDGAWVAMSLPRGAGTTGATATADLTCPDSAGVLTVTVRATDGSGNVASADASLVVYGSDDGHITGGGWILSPEGAVANAPRAAGKARFSFTAQYRKRDAPQGSLRFRLKEAGLDFRSTGFEWLLVDGQKAFLQGEGKIDGDRGYRFVMAIEDAGRGAMNRQDAFRIVIWSPDGAILYDCQMGADLFADPTTPLGGGAVRVHP